MNAFELGTRKVIPATLVYAFAENSVLMIHRNQPGDFHFGKFNGLGGKLELDESPLEGAVREFAEESGVRVQADLFQWAGNLYFPNFKAGQDWWVSVFRVDLPQIGPVGSIPEGALEWVEKARLLELPLWPGDRLFLPHLLTGRLFSGTIWYGPDGSVAKHSFLKNLVNSIG